MDLKKDKVVVLSNNEKYIIVNETIYGGIKYFLLAGVTEDEDNLTGEYSIMQEIVEFEKTYLQKVTDLDLVQILAKILKSSME